LTSTEDRATQAKIAENITFFILNKLSY
jgi:hypothetical protein